jgi:hypothetical protein
MSLEFGGPLCSFFNYWEKIHESRSAHPPVLFAILIVSSLSVVSTLAGCRGGAAAPPMAPEVKVLPS